jgi:8-oxo-dGTP diphosphatase
MVARKKLIRRREGSCTATGYGNHPVTLTGVYKDINRAIVARVFRCKITGDTLTASEEVTALR